METTRRSVLRAGGVAAVLSATGLAGCSGLLGGGSSGPSDYQYDPGSLQETQTQMFGSADYAGLYEARENFPESTRQSFESGGDSPVDPADIETMTGVGGAELSMSSGPGTVFGSFGVLGAFERGTIEESIQSEGNAEQTGEYEGFTLYENAGSASPNAIGGVTADTTTTAAVGDGVLVVGFAAAGGGGDAGVTGDQAARTMIDAGNGNAELLRSNSDYATQLDDRLGDSSVVVGGEVDAGLVEAATQGTSGMRGQLISGLRAGGFGMRVDGETTTMNAVAIYTDAESAEQSGVKELVDLGSQQAVDGNPGLDSVSASYDGSAVVVTVEGDTRTIFEQGPAGGPGTGFDVSRPRSVAGGVDVPRP
jgi:hypothetical protein